MEKIHITRGQLLRESDMLGFAPYASLQHLLRFESPTAYNAGDYGWNYDVYSVHGITICTGYRYLPGKRLSYIDVYDAAARNILNDRNLTSQRQEDYVREILADFCAKNRRRFEHDRY